jgi:hypothetical protein
MSEKDGEVTTQDLVEAGLYGGPGTGDEPQRRWLKRDKDGLIAWPLAIDEDAKAGDTPTYVGQESADETITAAAEEPAKRVRKKKEE